MYGIRCNDNDHLSLVTEIITTLQALLKVRSKIRLFYHDIHMKALVYDSLHKVWFKFEDPVQTFSAYSTKDILSILQAVEASTQQNNLHAVGFLCYEASPAFDTLFVTQTPNHQALPLALFALFKEPEVLSDLPSLPTNTIELSPFIPDTSKITYLNDLAKIKTHLKNGGVYQVNYSIRLQAHYFGDPLSWFIAKAKENPGDYLFYVETKDFAIASLSPELFFEKFGSYLRSKPMKGTCKHRDGFASEYAAFLKNDPKNRAENLMIVDMIRNDMGRIAEMGSVTVPSLFDTETYPTVIQMTSTVCASTRESLPKILEALFPCASITGAPKIRSMEIIAALEKSPRGIYTGAFGHVKPGGNAKFNVAIRTACFDTQKHQVEYGTGGGIIWSSNPSEEWNECMTKAAVLGTQSDFYVLESLLLENGAVFLLDRHLNRLMKSCTFFGIAPNPTVIKNTVQNRILTLAQELTTGRYKIRVMVKSEADIAIEHASVTPFPNPYTMRLSQRPVDFRNPFLYHKTSNKNAIKESLATAHGAHDVILVNTRGELTETSIANLVLRIEGVNYTPPFSCGLLPGVFREELLYKGEISERILYPSDLEKAENIYAINSIRRWVTCEYLNAPKGC